MINAVYKAFNSKGKRRIAAVVAFFITILLTILMALGVTNLINTNHQLHRATFFEGIELALKFCEYSQDSQENGMDINAISKLLQDEIQDELQSASSEERQEFATNFGIQDATNLNEIFRVAVKSANSWLLREHVFEDSKSINIDVHQRDSYRFVSLYGKRKSYWKVWINQRWG